VLLPLPIWKFTFSPQHHTVPSALSAHAWFSPGWTATTPPARPLISRGDAT
jgi:hypothetical protein